MDLLKMTTLQGLRRLQQILDVRPPIECRKIIQLFAGADETRWDSQFVLDRDNDAAFAAAVELGDDKTSQSNGGLKFARLAERVAASRRIDHKQRFMRRVRVVLGESAFHLFKLGHKILFRVQSASRIAKQKVSLAFGGCLIRFITKGSWIGVVLSLNHFDAQPRCPNAKLLDRRCAKSVCCRQQDAVPAFL